MFFVLVLLFYSRSHGPNATPTPATAFVRFPESQDYNVSTFSRDECPASLCPGRTVWDIVWSFLATTFAVTWVYVHPNVLWSEETSWMSLRRRIFLMSLALLAPEVMIMWAFKKWRGAVMIKETINKARPKSCSYC